MARTAYYPGSFDPFTNGHLDILLQALAVADHVIIAIGTHASKVGLFSYEERQTLIEHVLAEQGVELGKRVSVATFDNLVVDAAKSANASLLIRGLRDGSDLDYEMQMAGMNGIMAGEIQTIFLPSSPETRPITATLVRQIAKMGGDTSHFVPEVVERALREKLAKA
ncbi:pantetheine-phosphate adenylyltransferase [Pseudahrensia aquimaris]|uniref:Phosphopantetheine adenylyltransferase n=1 Tax=Pseudahrensia aquimaris TaxID=744461 RepID=A0ABW3FJE9_9HYPH